MDFGTKIKITVTGDCKNPIITLLGNDSTIEVNCINASCGEYEVQVNDDLGTKCFTFKVECSNCKDCPPQIITKCLCTTNSDCPNKCDFCDSGVCNPKPCVAGCEDGTCLDDCIECVTNCTDGKICQSYIRSDGRECKKCVCPVGKFINSFGDCVSCIKDSDCGPCKVCDGAGNCIPKDCGTGACNPTTNTCVECVNSGNCGVNEQCVNNKCECIPGYCKNAAGVCEPCPCITDEDCGSCGVCKNKICVPKQCPNGQICDNGECKPLCDCNNPTSCGSGKVCKNKGSYCVCESCGSCENGCAEGCINKCGKGEGCQPNPCTGSCENGGQCGPNCGCNPITKKCEPCSEVTCGTNCGSLLGCKCAGVTCEKDNTCSGTCNDSFDCGPNCTCYLGKCVPCSFFSCTDCANQERCKCNGSCQGDPSAKCNDVLELNIVGCTIEGKLSTSKSCPCPVITAKINNTTSDFSSTKQRYVFDLELFKGVTTESKYRLDQTSTPGIADNELPIGGSFAIIANVRYKINNVIDSTSTIVSQSMSLSGQGIGILGNKLTFDLDKFGINLASSQEQLEGKTKFVDTILFEAYVNEANFPNTCEYISSKIGEKIVVSNLAKFETTNLISSPGFKVPLFTWFKSEDGNFSTKLKDIYPTLVGESWADVLEAPEAESCFSYNLVPDCGCADSKSKRVVFCSPLESSVNVVWEKCNTIARVSAPIPCEANKNKLYNILVDTGSGYSNDFPGISLASGLNNFPIEKTIPIKGIKIKLACDSQDACTITKVPTETSYHGPEPSISCVGGLTYTFFDPSIKCVKFGSNVKECNKTSYIYPGQSGVSYSYTVEFLSGCVPITKTISYTCCEEFKPTVQNNCGTSKYTFSNTKPGVTYKVDGVEVNITNLSIYDTVKTLEYSAPECSGLIYLPSKSQCCDNPFTFTTQATSNSIIVTVNGVAGQSFLIKKNNADSQTLNLVSSTGTYTYGSLANGNYTISVTSLTSVNCKNPDQKVIVGSCSPSLTLGNQDCNLTASTTGSCTCKPLTWSPRILSVVKTEQNITVFWESNINYQDALLISGNINVTATPSSATNLNNLGYISGSNTIPCESVTSSVFDGQIVLTRDTSNGKVNVKFPPSFTYPISSVKIATVNSPIDPSLRSTTFINGLNQWEVSEVDGGVGGPWLYAIEIVTAASPNPILINPPGQPVNFYGTEGYSLHVNGTTYNCLTSIPVEFILSNVELEDGCKYATKTSSVVITDFNNIPTLPTVNLEATNPTSRKIKYIWTEDNIIDLVDFKSSGQISSYNKVDSINSQYHVKTDCNCTPESSTLLDSCLTLPSFTNVTLFPDKVTFVITGGCYTADIEVDIPGSVSSVIVPKLKNVDTTTQTINLSAPLTSSQYLTGRYVAKPSCSFNTLISTSSYMLEVTPGACDAGSCTSTQYPITVRVKKGGSYINITSITAMSPPGPVATGTGTSTVSIGCFTQGTAYTFTVNADGLAHAGSTQKNCTASCTLSDLNVSLTGVVSPNPVCLTTTNVIVGVSVGVPGSFLYGIDGAAITTPLTSTISIPLGSSPYTHSVSIKELSEADSCAVTKTITFNPIDCTVVNHNCATSGNTPYSNVTLFSQNRCDITAGFSETPYTATTTNGTAPYTYQWSVTKGTATFSGSSTALIPGTITLTGFDVNNQVQVQLETTDSLGCKGYSTYTWSTPPTCIPGQVICGTGCPKTCVPAGTCINGSECKSPDAVCGGTCCQAPNVCSNSIETYPVVGEIYGGSGGCGLGVTTPTTCVPPSQFANLKLGQCGVFNGTAIVGCNSATQCCTCEGCASKGTLKTKTTNLFNITPGSLSSPCLNGSGFSRMFNSVQYSGFIAPNCTDLLSLLIIVNHVTPSGTTTINSGTYPYTNSNVNITHSFPAIFRCSPDSIVITIEAVFATSPNVFISSTSVSN